MSDPKKCLAFVASSRDQCKKPKIRGSKYCWHHHPWGTNVLSGFIGLVLAFFINIASNRMSERAPKLEAYINGYKLSDDTVFVYPTNQPSEEFTFWINNVGNLSASEIFVMMNVDPRATNFIYGPKWKYEEVGWIGHTETNVVKMFQTADKTIPPKYSGKFQPFSVNLSKVGIFCGWVTFGGIGAKTQNGRVHFAFKNPPGITNVLYGQEARKFLEKISPTAGTSKQTGVVQFVFETTNQLELFYRTGEVPP